HLWANDGTLLATATFTNETATGWQQVSFSSPVVITANTLYVASYYDPAGMYALTAGYFAATSVSNGPLHAPADGANSGNGLYHIGSGGGFPGNTYNSNNYWVDVLYSQNTNDTTTPTVTSVSPTGGARGVVPSTPITTTFSEAVIPSSISFTARD